MTLTLDPARTSIVVHTFAQGLLSRLAHDLEIAAHDVTGSAEDFCFLVTQRRALSALDVTAVGEDAQRWLEIAQAFAGPPGSGR